MAGRMRTGAVVAAVVLGLAACVPADDAVEPSPTPTVQPVVRAAEQPSKELVEEMLRADYVARMTDYLENYAYPLDDPIGDKQRRVLEESLETFIIEYEVLLEAFEDMLQCMDEAGLEVERMEPVELVPGQGILSPQHNSRPTTGEQIIQQDHCFQAHYSSVWVGYESQPRVTQAWIRRFEEDYMQQSLDCLRESGFNMAEDASSHDVFEAFGMPGGLECRFD